MQQLTQAPRDGLTAEQVTSLLVDLATQWQGGLELADPVVGWIDISDDLESGSVKWDATQDTPAATGVVYRSCQLKLTRELAWGLDRIRPYLIATDPESGLEARFDTGVFVLTTPQTVASETPITYDVVGSDLLQQFVGPIDDTITFAAGTFYLDNAVATILAIDPAATILFDGTAASTPLPGDMVYALTESDQPTRLGIVNEQLAGAGYSKVWVDEEGNYRAQPIIAATARAIEWPFTADDPRVTMVGELRTQTKDVWNAFNSWKFVISGLSFTPIEGSGQYTPPDNVDGGDTSINAIGRRNQHTVYLTAADQASLVAQGDAIVAQDSRPATTMEITTYPFPLAGQYDVVTYRDAVFGDDQKLIAQQWVIDLGGDGKPPADTQWTLQGV